MIITETGGKSKFPQIERMYQQGLPIDTIVEVTKVDRVTVEGVIQKFNMLNETYDFPEPELGSDFG